MPEDSLNAVYRECLLKEYQKYSAASESSLSSADTRLSEGEILEEASEEQLAELLEQDLLIDYQDSTYRTTHFDLIFRLVNIRNRERQPSLVTEHKIEVSEQYVPDFDSHNLASVLHFLPDRIFDPVCEAFSEADIDSFSSHQKPVIESILNGEKRYLSLEAPTASGKTYAFLLPGLVQAFIHKMEGNERPHSLLLYPRKALARDQYDDILEVTWRLNTKLRRLEKDQITVAIEDGDRKYAENYDHGESYRGLSCCAESCSGDLLIQNPDAGIHVDCSSPDCPVDYGFVIVGREEIEESNATVTVSNIYMVYQNLMRANGVDRLRSIEYIVFDEAHVNTNYKGGHVSYIIELLKDAASRQGNNPQFVFSSATMSEPKTFVTNLAGISEDELAYFKYSDEIEREINVSGINPDKRVLVHLYLLPTPDRTLETLNQALSLALGLWSEKHDYRTINFIDSINQINKMEGHIKQTILSPTDRRGREALDHIFPTDQTVESAYSWEAISPQEYTKSRGEAVDPITSEFRNLYGTHHGQLQAETRSAIENYFDSGELKYLFATGTLEVGIDLSNIAAVLQYRLPPSREEGVIQRVGRAGREESTQRVGLGIVAFASNPASQMYMYDDDLTERLRDPSNLEPERIANTRSIKLQHILSLLLYERALKGEPTYMAGGERLGTITDAIDALKQILGELEAVHDLNDRIGLLSSEEIQSGVDRLDEYLSTIIEGQSETSSDTGTSPSEVITTSQHALRKSNSIKSKLNALRGNLETKHEFSEELDNRYSEISDTIDDIYDILVELVDALHRSWTERDSAILDDWFEANYEALEHAWKSIPSQSDLEELRFGEIMPWISAAYGSPTEFHDATGIRQTDISSEFNDLTEQIYEEDDYQGLEPMLSDLLDDLVELRSIDLKELSASKSLDKFAEEARSSGPDPDIFTALNRMLQGRAQFSVLLEPPRPSFEMEFNS